MNKNLNFVDKIIHGSLSNKLIVFMLYLGVVAWGLWVMPFDINIGNINRSPVPVDAIPDIGENQQIVFTEWMGRSPKDIEDQVTYPLTVSLQGIPGVKTIRSFSYFGFSSIYVIFEEDVDFYWSRSRLLEKLNSSLKDLPPGITPVLGPDATALGQIFWYTVEGKGFSLHELRTIQDFYIKYSLQSSYGVSEVASIGGHTREYQVDVDPDLLRRHSLDVTMVNKAIKEANIDIGAKTIDINSVEYVVRGLGFIKSVKDIENIVLKSVGSTPIYIKDVAKVVLGPALRRGVLDKEGAEVVGGVVVSRFGENPREVIREIKKTIQKIASGLPEKTLEDGSVSQVEIIPFYDRSILIDETLDTLESALTDEIFITIIVVLIMLMNLRVSFLVSLMLPLAVLMTFILMKLMKVDSNIMSLSGIAIAIGTIVDMGIIVTENIIKKLKEPGSNKNPFQAVFAASSEVGSAILTAILTTIVSFLPIFTMTGAEGRLFTPLAWTKTFALISSVVIALTLLPLLAQLILTKSNNKNKKSFRLPNLLLLVLVFISLVIMIKLHFLVGLLLVLSFSHRYLLPWYGKKFRSFLEKYLSWIIIGIAGLVLTGSWRPLGYEVLYIVNLLFVALIFTIIMGFFRLFYKNYEKILRFSLSHKKIFFIFPLLILITGGIIWIGFEPLWPLVILMLFFISVLGTLRGIVSGLLLLIVLMVLRFLLPDDTLLKTWLPPIINFGLISFLLIYAINHKSISSKIISSLSFLLIIWTIFSMSRPLSTLMPGNMIIQSTGPYVYFKHKFPGIEKEFMPNLDEGSYLYMPTTMPHSSISESLDIMQLLDKRLRMIPEVESVVGKLGRVDSALDPAPISMIETIITYKPKYMKDENGKRKRMWRKEIETPDDIWDEIIRHAKIPGLTSAPKLQPISTRIVMLQSGMRAPMGIKVKGPSLELIEQAGFEIEKQLKLVEGVEPATVFADRVVGKPYLEIIPDREKLARYDLNTKNFLDVLNIVIGGVAITKTVEGRETYNVRVRYQREKRNSIKEIGNIYIPVMGGAQVPLSQLAEIRYRPGPMVIKAEDTFLTSYVLFDKKKGYGEVNVVENAQRFLAEQIENGALKLPDGVNFDFTGNYENQVRSQKTLILILPIALFLIFLILYLQFKNVPVTGFIFSSIFIALCGGMILLYAYSTGWFLYVPFGIDEYFLGTSLRELFNVRQFNLSVAVWVGFLALFGIASDDGVVMTTYLEEIFRTKKAKDIAGVRELVVEGAKRRALPCIMTLATTIIALIPVVTSRGRGSDVMVPMAIPVLGGMIFVLITMFMIPVMYSWYKELDFQKEKGLLLKYEEKIADTNRQALAPLAGFSDKSVILINKYLNLIFNKIRNGLKK